LQETYYKRTMLRKGKINLRKAKILGMYAIGLSTDRPKRRLDAPALSGHLLYSLVNHAYANRYQHHLVRQLVSNIIMERYGFHIIISIRANDA